MRLLKLGILAIGCSIMLFACSKSNSGPEQPVVQQDTMKMIGTNWVPARALKVRETSYTYDQVIPYKGADGKLIYDKARSEKRNGKGYIYYDEKYKVVYVVDWPGDQATTASQGGHRPFYFNFDTRDTVAVADAQAGTKPWHVKHYDIYNAYMFTDAVSPAGQPGLGKVRVVRTPFDELDEALATPMIRNTVEIEMDEFVTTDGWGTYRLSDHILRPYKDRTIIFQLKDGRYVKYQLVNLYRSNPKVVNDKYEFQAPFYNFRYHIQQTPNDRNLKTR